MAIARDAVAAPSAFISASTSVTWNHTISGSNRLLVVGIWNDSSPSDVVTGVTYNGSAMTRINIASRSSFAQYLYAIVAPATGTHAVVVSFSGVQTFVCGSSSYTGVSQTGLPDAQGTANNTSSATIAVTVTTVAVDCWLIAQYGCNGGNSSAGTGASLATNEDGNSVRALYDSNASVGAAGSHSMTINNGNSASDHIMNLVSVAPAVIVYTLTADYGTFSLTGRAVSLIAHYVMAAAYGTYAFTGNAVNLSRAYILAVTTGPYTLTGNAAQFTKHLTMAAATGLYALTGQAVSLSRSYMMHVGTGLYQLTGQSVKFLINGLQSIFSSKYTPQGNSFTDKFESQNTQWQDKFH